MDIIELSKPLSPFDIEIRTGMAGKNDNGVWATLLAYKTSRVDVARLNSVCGLDWCCSYYYDQKGFLVCKIGIYNQESKQWVYREDVGKECKTGNDIEKSVYSDALKRAGFRWGVGLELYSMPLLFVNLNNGEYYEKQVNGKGKINPKLSGWSIDYDYDKNNVVVLDRNGKIRCSAFWSFIKSIKEQQ